MKKTIILFFIFSFSFFIHSSAQIITTIAGDSLPGYSGDSIAATNTKLNAPCGVAVDRKGNIYIADQNNYRVRKVDTNGVISTFAGIGIPSYSGNGGPASAAGMGAPSSVAVDKLGNIYITDPENLMVRKVDTNGIIWRFIGGGGGGYSGDGGLATNSSLNNPSGIAVDDSGNIYVADVWNNVIRKVNMGDTISTFAGNGYGNGGLGGGYTGDGGPATNAELYSPTDVSVDLNGNLFITDYYNHRIRMVNTNGVISTVAGDSARGFSGDGGAATDAELYEPFGIVMGDNNIYIVDQHNVCIRMFNNGGNISTIAGNGISGYFGDGGPATAAEFHLPTKIAVDASNNIYIADQDNNVIRKITDTNTVTGITKLRAKGEEAGVFPNPSNGTFNLHLTNFSNKCNIVIFNYLGENIYTTKINSANTEINIQNQSDGVYFYRVLSENGVLIGEGKFVIEK